MNGRIRNDRNEALSALNDEKSIDQSVRFLIENTFTATGEGLFKMIVKYISTQLDFNYVFISKCANHEASRVRTVAFWELDKIAQNVEYDLDGTPCKDVISGKYCCYNDNLISLFPEDEDLKNYDPKSYLGVPIYNSHKKVIGHLAVFHTKPIENISKYFSILRVFALRAGSEMERMEYEDSLKQSNSELEKAYHEIKKLQKSLEEENYYLKEEIKKEHNFEEIIGESKALQEILQKVKMVAGTDSTVLIRGETGTGKEQIARSIHNLSSRTQKVLVKVNCPAIPSGLIESELFGHEKGAFTGALTKKIGKFELADGGTIFLDELGDLPLEAQAKLLRVLQEREFERVGSNEIRKVDVRIIAATNRDLETAVKEGKFRADLYYRLNVFPISVPSLSERKEDIPLLAMYFTQRYANKIGKQIDSISDKDIERLKSYSWPGNIRELENIIERAVIVSTGSKLNLGEIQSELSDMLSSMEFEPLSLEHLEREHMKKVLNRTKWQINGEKGAAKILGINPNTLRSRIVKLGLKKELKIMG